LLAAEERRNPSGIAIVEAAILIETGSYKRFDRLVLVSCRPEQQIQRAMDRGLSREEAEARIDRQMSLDEKRKYAHYVIDTSGDKADTLAQTRQVYEELVRLSQ
ncbi:MAG TPA: dephospho-CoA kinase, partial [Bryobacteraceae bacterium]|nr:dephospho-CoA kinase [Bryobacteraceae bacterium]